VEKEQKGARKVTKAMMIRAIYKGCPAPRLVCISSAGCKKCMERIGRAVIRLIKRTGEVTK
jgi:hypothetical protein